MREFVVRKFKAQNRKGGELQNHYKTNPNKLEKCHQ